MLTLWLKLQSQSLRVTEPKYRQHPSKGQKYITIIIRRRRWIWGRKKVSFFLSIINTHLYLAYINYRSLYLNIKTTIAQHKWIQKEDENKSFPSRDYSLSVVLMRSNVYFYIVKYYRLPYDLSDSIRNWKKMSWNRLYIQISKMDFDTRFHDKREALEFDICFKV